MAYGKKVAATMVSERGKYAAAPKPKKRPYRYKPSPYPRAYNYNDPNRPRGNRDRRRYYGPDDPRTERYV